MASGRVPGGDDAEVGNVRVLRLVQEDGRGIARAIDAAWPVIVVTTDNATDFRGSMVLVDHCA